MRIIKFRAWDKTSNRMIGWGTILNSFNLQNMFIGLCNLDLMQYTGLKDKNNMEIYEGDMLKHPYGGIGVVRFHKNWGAFYYDMYSSRDEYGDIVQSRASNPFYNDTNKFEIIGNIYENPDLAIR